MSFYYQRQKTLKEIGEEGQRKLARSNVLVIGAGGLGSPVLTHLAAAGVGKLSIYDKDVIEESNLHRQTLFSWDDLGNPKAAVAAGILAKRNPFIQATPFFEAFDKNVDIDAYDAIVDCSDNFKTKFEAHDLCYARRKIFVLASIHKFQGQLSSYDFSKNDPSAACLRCLWPQTPAKDCVSTCEEEGVLGAATGALGAMQAMEVLKRLLDFGKYAENTTFIDLLDFSIMKIKTKKNSLCPLCSNAPLRLKAQEKTEKLFEQALKEGALIVSLCEAPDFSTPDILLNPNESLDAQLLRQGAGKDTPLALICRRGITSLRTARILREIGFSKCYSITGGWEEVKQKRTRELLLKECL